MFCSKCGNEIQSNAAFCANCGSPVRRSHANSNTTQAGARTAARHSGGSTASVVKGFPEVLSSAAAFLFSLPKVALAAVIGVVVIVGGVGIAAIAIPHGDIPNGTYSAQYGTTSIGQGGSVEIWGNNMSIKHIAGSAYDTDMSPYKVSGNRLYYMANEDDFFWISRFYTSTTDGQIVFDYRKSGNDIVLDDVTYYKK